MPLRRKEIWKVELGVGTKWILNLLATSIMMVIYITSESNHQKPSYIFISCSYLAENQTKPNPTKPEYLRAWASVNYLGDYMCYLKCASRSYPSPKPLGALLRLEPPDCWNGSQIASFLKRLFSPRTEKGVILQAGGIWGKYWIMALLKRLPFS